MESASTFWKFRAAMLFLVGVALAVYGVVSELTYEPPSPVLSENAPPQFDQKSGGTALIGIGVFSVAVGGALLWNERRKRRALNPPWAA